MMTRGIKKRMYRNIAMLIFILLAALVAAFANEPEAAGRHQKKMKESTGQPSQGSSIETVK
jgi:hypothetical protein